MDTFEDIKHVAHNLRDCYMREGVIYNIDYNTY